MTTQYKVSQLPAANIGNTATDVAVVNVAGATSKVSIQDIANKGAAAITPTGGTMGVVGAVTATGGFGGNATTATALAVARNLWGQPFTGAADVSGAMTGVTTITTSGDITETNAIDGSTVVKSQNTNAAGTGAAGILAAQASTAIALVQANGTGRVASRWGVTLADWVEYRNNAGSGMAVGTVNATPLILGTNATNRIQIAGTGEVTIATVLGIGPGTPGANGATLHSNKASGENHIAVGNGNNGLVLGVIADGTPFIGGYTNPTLNFGAYNAGAGNTNWATLSAAALTSLSAVNATTTVSTGSYTVATLPTALITARAFVTDATAPAFGAAVVGLGAVKTPVYSDGSTWLVG